MKKKSASKISTFLPVTQRNKDNKEEKEKAGEIQWL